MGPVDFVHFFSPSPFKWLKNKKYISHLEKERLPQGFEIISTQHFLDCSQENS